VRAKCARIFYQSVVNAAFSKMAVEKKARESNTRDTHGVSTLCAHFFILFFKDFFFFFCIESINRESIDLGLQECMLDHTYRSGSRLLDGQQTVQESYDVGKI